MTDTDKAGEKCNAGEIMLFLSVWEIFVSKLGRLMGVEKLGLNFSSTRDVEDGGETDLV